jgi:hypothetical protein
LYHRIRLYEWVQEQHRRHDDIRVLNTASGDSRILCDLADLPRLSLFSADSTKNRETIINSGLESEISLIPKNGLSPADGGNTIAIVSAAQLHDYLLKYRPDAVLIADTPALDENGRAAVTESLSGEGYAFGERFGGLGYRTCRWKN